jgi:hypothetical protein
MEAGSSSLNKNMHLIPSTIQHSSKKLLFLPNGKCHPVLLSEFYTIN